VAKNHGYHIKEFD